MITEKQKTAILKAIGKKHIAKIKAYAASKKIIKEDGEEYANSTFSMVLNGKLEHPDIEEVIFSTAEFYFHKAKEERERRERFVKRVNTGA